MAGTDELVERRARALVQHQQIMAEAEELARSGAQARRLAHAAPVFATAPTATARSVRKRIEWFQTS